jgi:hypothetical protein
LRSDAAASKGVRRKVTFLVWAIILTTALVTVAAIATPLGLYETITPDKVSTLIDFHYVRDSSALGAGTPPRPSLGFSRICENGNRACPNTGQNITIVNVTTSNGLTSTEAEAPYGYDTRIPKKYFDFLESGVSHSRLNQSVSSTFDIQWRTWTTSALNGTDVLFAPNSSYFNNGSAYTLGSYRSLTNILLNDAWDVVEGLIVDSRNGGVGFRNHTMPSQPLPYGAQWSEDILFVEPVTECVNLNVSLDFSLTHANFTNDLEITSPRLVDRGGFVNFDRRGLPFIAIGNQTDPLLAQRAQTGAWITDMLMMLVWNITDRHANGSATITPPFTYLNSQLGKEYPLPTSEGTNKPASSSLSINSYRSIQSYNDLATFFSLLTPLPQSSDSNITSTIFNYTNLPANPYNYHTTDMTPFGKILQTYSSGSTNFR